MQEALPLVCRLRDGLQAISSEIRFRAGLTEVWRTGLLRRPTCPIDEKNPMSSGPIQQIQTLKDYFCNQADAARNHCRIVIDDSRGHPA